MAELITKTLTVVEYNGKGQHPKSPYDIVMVDDDGNRGYYKTWEENEATMLSKGGDRRWEVSFMPVEQSYVSKKDAKTYTSVSNNIKSIQSAQPAEVAEPKVEEPTDDINVDGDRIDTPTVVPLRGMDDRGRSIIRQVAFKAAVDTYLASGAVGENYSPDFIPTDIYNLTNKFEQVIFGTYEPQSESTDFIEEEF